MRRTTRLPALLLVGLLGMTVVASGCRERLHTDVVVHDGIAVDWVRTTPATCEHGVLPYRVLPTRFWSTNLPGRWPLIVLAPGYRMTGAGYDRLARDLASAGYVVAAPTFPVSGPTPCPVRSDLENQPGDVSTVISYALGPDSPVAGTLDGRVGVIGHSDGGMTASAMAQVGDYDDPRVSAYAVLSGGLPAWLGPVHPNRVPLLSMAGDQDQGNPIEGPIDVYNRGASPRAFVALIGGDHTSPWFGVDGKAHVARDALVAFLDRWVRNDPDGAARFRSLGGIPGTTWFVLQGF